MKYKKASCIDCPFRYGERPPVEGKGNINSVGMVVAESPGRLEYMMEEPLVGDSGGILNFFLRKSGLIKSVQERYKSLYFTNALKCYPATGFVSAGRGSVENKVDVTSTHLTRCRHFLVSEFERVKPKYVLSLGSPALKAIFNDHSLNVTDLRGFWKYSDEFDCWVLPTLHPAFVLRSWEATSSVLLDIENFRDGIEHGVPEYKLGDYTLVDSTLGAREIFRTLKSAKRLSWDSEATSLEYWKDDAEILGFSFSWEFGKAVWIPLLGTGENGRHRIWSDAQYKYIWNSIKSILEDGSIKKDGQNTKFDILWCKANGIEVRGVDWDVMQFHHLVDENTPSNLTYLTLYYNLLFPRYEDELLQYVGGKSSKNKKYEKVPGPILGKYACADSDAVFRIRVEQLAGSVGRQRKLYRKLSVPISKFTTEMEYTGALIDIPKISGLEKEYDIKIEDEGSDLARLVGADTFNPNSPQQVSKLLFEKLKLKSKKKSKKGKPSTDKKEILRLKEESKSKKVRKIMDLIGLLRKMKKLKSTYLTGFKKLVDKCNRLHTSYRTTGTVVGRLSSSNPNLQNIPTDPIFRSIFIAGPGRKLIIADYSQVEARILALLADEIALLEKFGEEGFDIHTYTFSQITGLPQEGCTKEQRIDIKAVTFGINYGRSSRTIAESYGMEVQEVDVIIDGYFTTYSKIYDYRERLKETALTKGILFNPFGRARHFDASEWIRSVELGISQALKVDYGMSTYPLEMVAGHVERQAMNFPISSYASDNLVLAIDRIRKRIRKLGLDAFFILTIHDALIIDSADECAEEVKTIVEKLMPVKKTSVSGTRLTLSADVSIEDHWVQ